MDQIIISLVIVIAIIATTYQLGYFTMQAKKARKFHGALLNFKNENKAVMRACTGIWARKIIIKKDGTYTWNLEYEVTEGDVKVHIRDKNKEDVLFIDMENPTGSITVSKGEKYLMVIKTQTMSGRYKVTWKCED